MVFDANGEMIKMDFATSAGLPETLKVLAERGHTLDQILPCMTTNVARLLRLRDKGKIEAGADADLVVMDDDHQVQHVMANGAWMVRDGEATRRGTFE